jgi:hypothetical protein
MAEHEMPSSEQVAARSARRRCTVHPPVRLQHGGRPFTRCHLFCAIEAQRT